jgi:hypothetical protein
MTDGNRGQGRLPRALPPSCAVIPVACHILHKTRSISPTSLPSKTFPPALDLASPAFEAAAPPAKMRRILLCLAILATACVVVNSATGPVEDRRGPKAWNPLVRSPESPRGRPCSPAPRRKGMLNTRPRPASIPAVLPLAGGQGPEEAQM